MRCAWRIIDTIGTAPVPPPSATAGVAPSHAKKPPMGSRISISSPTRAISAKKPLTSPSS
ncbi:hypothetical protein [Clavibacter tessellarius]|uniref:hypothetical protein n=1 Tax=Clavibacter tessellarius TaxID=31965 RepID=UPI00324D0753